MKIVYELATPITESAVPYQETQIVDNWGTEEYFDPAYEQGDRDFEMPVGHISEYPISLRDKIEVAPDSPAQDGLYLMKRENGMNRYYAYTDSGRIVALEEKIPEIENTVGDINSILEGLL